MKILPAKTAAAVIAAAIAAAGISSCGVKDTSAAEFTRRSSVATAETQTVSETETVSPTETVAADIPAETAETTTAPTETTTTAKPVEIKDEVLADHSFGIADFPEKVYSNKKLQKALDEIDGICSRYGGVISFAYMNMDTGAACTYRADVSYGCCSTVKAPFCKNILESGIDLDEEVPINVKWDYDGGTVASMEYGSRLTARELIRYAITESDNTAYYNLVNYYGYVGFNNMNYELGVNYNLGSSWIFNYCTTNDLLKQYIDVYNYAEKSKRGQWLVKLMTKTELETQITAQLGDKYTVAHKYGSDWDQNCYHDCAIVYADSPFILIIMTNQIPETEDSDKVFKQLAKQFDIVNSQLAV